MMNNTLETAPKGETRKLRSILGYKKGGALEVSSIKADSAKTIAVEFSREVVDEEAKELAFKVLRGKTDIKVDLVYGILKIPVQQLLAPVRAKHSPNQCIC